VGKKKKWNSCPFCRQNTQQTELTGRERRGKGKLGHCSFQLVPEERSSEQKRDCAMQRNERKRASEEIATETMVGSQGMDTRNSGGEGFKKYSFKHVCRLDYAC